MSCGCENQKKARELDRTRRLAKALARIESEDVYLYINPDGTYGFDVKRNLNDETSKKVTEIITRY